MSTRLNYLKVIFFFIWISSSLVYAQKFENYVFKQINKNSGLSGNHILSLTQDQEGFLWIGTPKFINRYDGQYFKKYKIQYPDSITSKYSLVRIFCTSKGELLIGGSIVPSIYNGKTDRFDHWKPEGIKPFKNDILSFFENQHKELIIGLPDRIAIRNAEGTWREISPSQIKGDVPGSFKYVISDNFGSLWIATDDGIFQMDQKTLSCRLVNSSVKGSHKIDIDADGKIWITTGAGVFVSENNKIIPLSDVFPEVEALKSLDARSIYFGKDGSTFIGTDFMGFFTIKDNAVSQVLANNQNKLSSNQCWNVFVDNNNNLYISTLWDGLNVSTPLMKKFLYIDNGKNSNYSVSNSANTTKIFQYSDSIVYVSTDGLGLYKLNLLTNKYICLSDKYGAPKKIIDISKFNNKLILSTWNEGLIEYDIESNTFAPVVHKKDYEKLDFPLNLFFNATDNRGNIWVSSLQKGMFLYDQKSDQLTDINQRYNLNIIGATSRITLGKNDDIWIFGPELISFKWVKDSLHLLSKTTINDPSGKSESIYSLCFGKNNVFATTEGGVYKKTSDGPFEKMDFFLEEDYLKSSIEYDENRKTIVFTGIDHITTYDEKTGVIHRFGKETGIDFGFLNTHTSKQLRNTNFAFGTTKGVFFIENDFYSYQINKPNIYFRNYYVDYKKQGTLKSEFFQNSVKEASELNLPYGRHNYSIEVGDISLGTSPVITYEYKIEGFQNDWISTGSNENITINIPSGQYTLMVRAKYPNSSYCNPIQIKINSPTPFYRTYWFISICFVLLIVLIYIIIQLRTRAIKRKNQLLESKIKQRTEYIEEQNKEISAQKHELEEGLKMGEIIQDSIMPDVNILSSYFQNHFLLYQQRDPVGGDFYWIREKNNKIYIAVGDCTGHGVSGGLLTMMAVSLLHESLNSNSNPLPSEILTDLNNGVRYSLHHGNDDKFIGNGMDISLMKFDKKTLLMEYSGAMNPILILRNNIPEYLQVKKLSIGMIPRKNKVVNYETSSFQLKKDDIIIMQSDGYIDQLKFIGEDIKKFTKSKFLENIQGMNIESFESYPDQLLKAHNEWKNGGEQTDDIVILGLIV